jgi:hypothetical protein
MSVEEFRKRLMADNKSAFERVQTFLIVYWGSGLGDNEIREMLRENYQMFPHAIPAEIAAAKSLLETNDYDEALLHTIAWEVNHRMPEETPAGARRWLEEKIRFTEEAIASIKP